MNPTDRIFDYCARHTTAPAELLESALRRRLAAVDPNARGAGCRLQLVLDEFEHRFDDLQTSQAAFAARGRRPPPMRAAAQARHVTPCRHWVTIWVAGWPILRAKIPASLIVAGPDR